MKLHNESSGFGLNFQNHILSPGPNTTHCVIMQQQSNHSVSRLHMHVLYIFCLYVYKWHILIVMFICINKYSTIMSSLRGEKVVFVAI